MLNAENLFDVFNLPTIADLAMSWAGHILDMKILSCYYFGDLYERYPSFKDAFVPVCSICLMNGEMSNVINALSEGKEVNVSSMRVKGCFWECNNCSNFPCLHPSLAPVISASKLRRKICPVDVLNMHKIILDYYAFMKVSNCPTWQQQSDEIMRLHAMSILCSTPVPDSVSSVEVSFMSLSEQNVVMTIDVDSSPLIVSDAYLLKNNNIEDIRECDVVHESPTFESPSGTSFIFRLDPDSKGLCYDRNVKVDLGLREGEDEYNLIYQCSGRAVVYAFDHESRDYLTGEIDCSVYFCDVRGSTYYIKDISLNLMGMDSASFYFSFDFRHDQLLSSILDYNVMLRDIYMENYLVFDFYHGKRVAMECSLDVKYKYMYLDVSSDVVIQDNQRETFKRDSHVSTFQTNRGVDRMKFRYNDINGSDVVTDMAAYHLTHPHYQKRYAKQFKLFNQYCEITPGGGWTTDLPDELSIGRMFRFMCYSCHSKYKKTKYKDTVICDCSDSGDSYGCRLISSLDILKPVDGMYYDNLFRSTLQENGGSFVIGSSDDDNYVGSCSSCGSIRQVLRRPIYSDLGYCHGCLVKNMGMTDRMVKVFKKDKSNVEQYLGLCNWCCKGCGNLLDREFQAYPSRCAHVLKCGVCIKERLFCDVCICSPVNLLPDFPGGSW